jgi:thiol-disulfide isomerase/thioredoxin
MKQALVVLLVVSALFGLLKLFQRWDLANNGLAEGTPIAAFSLPDTEGKPFRLPIPGRPVLIHYWASWCGPCLVEMPLLQQFAKRNGANGTQLVAIALEDERGSRIWLRANPQPFPMLLEAPGPKDSSVGLGNAKGLLPFFVLVGADGRVRDSHTGAFKDQAELEDWVAAAR